MDFWYRVTAQQKKKHRIQVGNEEIVADFIAEPLTGDEEDIFPINYESSVSAYNVLWCRWLREL